MSTTSSYTKAPPTYGPDDIPEAVLDALGKTRRNLRRLETRVYSKISEINHETGCWVWGAATSSGYGMIARNGTAYQAHRVAYALNHGVCPTEIDGDVRHLCHNRLCVNPDHLRSGTRLDNIYDSYRDGKIDTALDPDEVRDIRRRYRDETDIRQIDLADEYGVSQPLISSVVRGEQYAWIE